MKTPVAARGRRKTGMILVLSITMAAVVVGCASKTTPSPSPRPGQTAGPTTRPTTAPPSQVPGPGGLTSPSSQSEATLFHLQFATGIDPVSGVPRGVGDAFPSGTTNISALLAWSDIPTGTVLRFRLYTADEFLYEKSHTVVTKKREFAGEHVGFEFGMKWDGGFPDGTYTAELAYNTVPDEVTSFTVGGPTVGGAVTGTGTGSGPIPYADPSDVLVVTRRSVLEHGLGSRADEVIAAASRVGRVHDLGLAGVSAELAASTIAPILRAGGYRYLLILGNHDAVPFFMLPNPRARTDAPLLKGWQLPADVYPSDDPYVDLDHDTYQIPDLAVARIPSSEDADLLITQLTERTPPDGGAYALVNQVRRSQAGAVVSTISEGLRVETAYSPPVDADRFNVSPGGNARYLYILMHGIGVDADEWSADTVVWREAPEGGDEWQVNNKGDLAAIHVDGNPGSQGVVEVGACYGAWTLDTVEGPTHKTADNSLALHYLKSGTRAFIADTHISYSATQTQGDLLIGRTGFEIAFWEARSTRARHRSTHSRPPSSGSARRSTGPEATQATAQRRRQSQDPPLHGLPGATMNRSWILIGAWAAILAAGFAVVFVLGAPLPTSAAAARCRAPSEPTRQRVGRATVGTDHRRVAVPRLQRHRTDRGASDRLRHRPLGDHLLGHRVRERRSDFDRGR